MESSDVDPLLEQLLFPSDGRAAYLLRLVEKHGERVLQLLEELQQHQRKEKGETAQQTSLRVMVRKQRKQPEEKEKGGVSNWLIVCVVIMTVVGGTMLF